MGRGRGKGREKKGKEGKGEKTEIKGGGKGKKKIYILGLKSSWVSEESEEGREAMTEVNRKERI